jgi:hypothetical protein
MGAKPFNVGGSAVNPALRRAAVNPLPKSPAVQPAKTAALAEGKKTLVEAAAEEMAADYEVGSAVSEQMDPDQIGDGVRPTYKAALPWPTAKAVGHKPFKL